MGAQGVTTVDFGAFPGKGDASVAVTAQEGILAGSQTEAYLYPVATADHSEDEHIAMAGAIRVIASAPSAGVGFTIYATAPDANGDGNGVDPRQPSIRDGVFLYGLWTVAWVWN